jgi:hypothetical protein
MKQNFKAPLYFTHLLLLILTSSTAFGQTSLKQFPISSAIESGAIERGGYETFEEFLNNSPSITDSFYVETKTRSNKNWEGTKQVIPRLVERDKKIKRVWGFSDGVDIYVFHQVEFFPFFRTGETLYFDGYDLLDDDGATTAAVLGGAIGGAIHASNQKAKKIRYEIDLKTGEPVHPEHKAAVELSRKNQFIIYRRSKKQSEKNAVFVINDSLTYSFEPDSYVHLVFPPELPVKICSVGDDKNCVELTFSSDPITYVQVLLPEESERLELEVTTESKGEFDYYKTEKKQNKRGPQKPIEVK